MKKLKLRKGISPILATVIMVAVTLVIAIAVVGWLMGIWGGVSQGSAMIKVTNAEFKVNGTSANLTIYIENQGSGSDELLKAEVLYGGKIIGTNTTTLTIPAGFKDWQTIHFTLSQSLNPGDQAIIRLSFRHSGTQSINVVALGG